MVADPEGQGGRVRHYFSRFIFSRTHLYSEIIIFVITINLNMKNSYTMPMLRLLGSVYFHKILTLIKCISRGTKTNIGFQTFPPKITF